MKHKVVLLSFLIIVSIRTFSANLLVKEDGYQGAYASIQAAINAASSGDSIIISNRYSGRNWTESLFIDKNVNMVNAIDSLRLTIVGNIAIQPSSVSSITLIGLDVYGDISANAAGISASNRSKINIIDCKAHSINMNYDNLDVSIIDCQGILENSTDWQVVAIYYINMRHGKIIGSIIGCIDINPDAAVSASNDTVIIIGNLMKDYSNYTDHVMLLNTNGYFMICNNYFSFFRNYGILHMNSNNAGPSNNLILNNSFSSSGPYGAIMMYLGSMGSNSVIASNVAVGGSNPNMLFATGSGGILTYNLWYGNPFMGNSYPTNGSWNYANTINGIFDNYGRFSQGKDRGYYPEQYNDIDLTRNDLGTYGGSYSIDNYFPTVTSSTGKGRIHFVSMPRLINNISVPINVGAGANTIH